MKKPLPPEPLLFLKPSTAVLDPGGAIKIPPAVGHVHYEGELAVVIGLLEVLRRLPPDLLPVLLSLPTPELPSA